MANKRMFSLHVAECGAFLDLPLSAQAVYFHLCLHADDDGFIDNARQITRMVGGSERDLRLLAEKEFLLVFPSGVMVIRHWRVHNAIRRDRMQPTQYLREKSRLVVEENNTYSLLPDDEEPAPVTSAEIPEPPAGNKAPAGGEDFERWWQCYPVKKGKAEARKAFARAIRAGVTLQTLLNAVEAQKSSRQWQEPRYIPHPATWLSRGSWEDEEYTPPVRAEGTEDTGSTFDAQAYRAALLATMTGEAGI